MSLEEKILQKVNNLPETEKAEVLDFIEYLKTKAGKKEKTGMISPSLQHCVEWKKNRHVIPLKTFRNHFNDI
jgi:hypothetical protein